MNYATLKMTVSGCVSLLLKRAEGPCPEPLVCASENFEKADGQTCDSDIMSGSHKASPGILEWPVFSLEARAELSIVTWARGHIPIPRGQHSLSISLIVSNTMCFCHHTQGFGNFTKNVFDRKFP